MKEAIIIIAKDGSSATTEVSGIKGPSCQDITSAFNSVLGELQSDKKLPEYYLQDLSVVHDHG